MHKRLALLGLSIAMGIGGYVAGTGNRANVPTYGDAPTCWLEQANTELEVYCGDARTVNVVDFISYVPVSPTQYQTWVTERTSVVRTSSKTQER